MAIHPEAHSDTHVDESAPGGRSQRRRNAQDNNSAQGSARENTIRWAQPPEKSAAGDAVAPAAGGTSAKRARPSRAVTQETPGLADNRPAKRPTSFASRHAIPDSVRRHFVQVGQDYYFSDGAKAFTDREVKLTTRSENTQLIRDLVLIAQVRGWQAIAVSGTKRFRKEAWEVAQQAGLAVRGYRSSAFDRERLVRLQLRESKILETVERQGRTRDAAAVSAERSQGVREPRERASRENEQGEQRRHAGRLVDHGPAPYRHDPHEPMSYFVKLETTRGDHELWGVDLERAFKQSLSRPQIGDEVVVRAVRQEPVTVKSRRHDEEAKVVEKALATHRNRWMVEKRVFLEARREAAQTLRDPSIAPAQGSRQHPELLGAYLQVHAAELAAKQFRDPQDQQRFVALVRGAVADSVARGEPMPAVRVRASDTRSDASRARGDREEGRASVRATDAVRS